MQANECLLKERVRRKSEEVYGVGFGIIKTYLVVTQSNVVNTSAFLAREPDRVMTLFLHITAVQDS
jgi:hypothetical protein